MLKFVLLAQFVLLSLSAFADSGSTLVIKPKLVFDDFSLERVTKLDEEKILEAVRLIEVFPPAADVIRETEPKIFITRTDSLWAKVNLRDPISGNTTMKLLNVTDPYRIIMFWDRVQKDPYPVLRISLSLLEIFNEMNPFELRLPSDVIGERLVQMYRRIEFLGQTRLSVLYPRLDDRSKSGLEIYLEVLQRQLTRHIESQRQISEAFFSNCGSWLEKK